MNVDSFLISEFAGTDAAQSLTVYRTFNQVVTSALPIGLPTLYLSMILHAHPDEAGEHEIEIRLLGSKRDLIRVINKGRVLVGEGQDIPGMPLRHTVVVGQVNFPLEREGVHLFEVHIDGTYHASASLFVHLKK